MIAGSDIANGWASSLTENVSRSESRASSARRVGSASAAKVRSKICSEYLTMWFSISANVRLSSKARKKLSGTRPRPAIQSDAKGANATDHDESIAL